MVSGNCLRHPSAGIERLKKSRAVRSLLMDVVNNFRKPLLPKQSSDCLRLLKIEHEPVAIVVVTGIVRIKLRRLATFLWSDDRLAIPSSNDIDAIRIWRRNKHQ